MTATLLYRIAAVLLIIFAAGHTVGFFTFTPPNPEGVAVRDAMNTVHFQVGNGKVAYGDFYRGFGIFCTVYLLFAAYVAWYLGGLARSNPQIIGAMGWAFFALHLASIVVSSIYFLAPPIVLSALVAICTGWAAWLASVAKA